MMPFGERLVAISLLLFCIAYGVSATTIDVFPGREHELVTSRTFPYLLSLAGSACVLWVLFSPAASRPAASAADGNGRPSFAWRRCAALVGTSAAYAFAIERLGFLLSTAAFLAAGMLVLGERRKLLIAAAALVPPAFFWLVLELGLDIRLPAFPLPGG